ncbi:MAG: DUF748 domain-containing protein [Geobacter sp.]|nr:DUF748 domain-containing protein [Geobacter sp.]
MKNPITGKCKKILLYTAIVLVGLAIILPVALTKYIATPHAASRISGMISDVIGQPVVIEQIDLSGGALHLKGLSVANPEGFPLSRLLSVDSMTIIPLWLKLLSGHRTFEKIELEGIAVDLQKNSGGVWNFSQMQRRFSSVKPSSAEILIHQLKITRGALQINDQRLAGLSLNVSDFANKGSEKSGFNLAFDDPGHNHYTLSGKARLDKEPELDLSLSSSSVSLKSLSGLLRSKSGYLPEQGNATLLVTANLRNGIVNARGEVGFSAASLPAVATGKAFGGNLTLVAGYDLRKDVLTIETLTLHLNKLLAIRASGTVRELKRAKSFVIDAGVDEIDVASIYPLFPQLAHGKITIGGRLDKSSLHLTGNAADGISSATGRIGFSHGLLKQGERLIFNDLTVNTVISSRGKSVVAVGKATQTKSEAGALLEALDAPFQVTFDGHLKSIKAKIPALSAKVKGVSLTARAFYADEIGVMEGAAVRGKDFTVSLARLSIRLPVKQVLSRFVRYPVIADFSGCDLQRGDALLKKLSGKIRGAYVYNPEGKWLEGTAQLAAEKVAWQGKEAGAPAINAAFSKAGGKADFTATLLGGSIKGDAVFNPFAPLEKVGFRLNAKGIRLAGVSKYAGIKGDLALSGGTLDTVCNGRYAKSDGLFCHLEAAGNNIAVTGKGGKSLLSSGGAIVNGDLSGKKLVLNQLLLTAGKDLVLNASGAIENANLPARQGRIAFNVPSTSLAALVDTFINAMPRSIQEATVKGGLATEGTINLQEGKILVDGAVTLANIGIDAPSGNMKVSGINGLLPLSLDLSGKVVAKPPNSSSFNRQNYASLMEQLRRKTEKVETITIVSASFSGLNLDSVKLRLRASRGVTEIISLDSSLYGGTLLGKGFITAQNGILYRGDMLINELSLVQLCKAFPAIAGYISGKIDGVLSIQGKGKQLTGISGFTEFWARETAGEKMLVSKEFLQRLSGKKLSGFFFSSDRAYDHAGIKASLEKGYLTFDSLDISHTNFLGVRDLSVTIAPSQNRIAIDHLLNSIKEATVRGKSSGGAAGKGAPATAPVETEFKWDE